MTILFLDFDGVLHPSAVYRSREQGIHLRVEGHALFEHAQSLADLLADFPEVRIVLSTSWVSSLGRFDDTLAYLPIALQSRVAGATWHSRKPPYQWAAMTRYEQIMEYVYRHQVRHWVAVDDDDIGWADKHREGLVHTDPDRGLGIDATQASLREKLQALRVAPLVDLDTSHVVHSASGCW